MAIILHTMMVCMPGTDSIYPRLKCKRSICPRHPLRKSNMLWEIAKQQAVNLLHGNLTPPRNSRSCVQEYHYLSDCHRHIGTARYL